MQAFLLFSVFDFIDKLFYARNAAIAIEWVCRKTINLVSGKQKVVFNTAAVADFV